MTTITPTSIETGELTIPAPVTDRRGSYAGELARVQAELTAAREQIAERDRTINGLRFDQITDGADARLVTFWEKGGRIADAADFCQEYDRIAEALGGPRREREYEVEAEVTVRIRVTYTTTATSEEEADENAHQGIDFDDALAAYRDNGYEDFDIEVISTEEA